MRLFVFGDSHRMALREAGRAVGLHVVDGTNGPFTMARFGMERSNLINLQSNGVMNGDVVAYSFGEIDCRVHLCQTQNFPHYKTLVDNIVKKYFEAIHSNITSYFNLRNIIYNVVPACKVADENIKLKPTPEMQYPFIGSNENRKEVALYVNSKLKEYCKMYNFIFFNIYDKYLDEDGLLQKHRSDGDVHITDLSDLISFYKSLNLC